MSNKIITFAGARHRATYSLLNEEHGEDLFAPSFCWDLNFHYDVEEINQMINELRSTNNTIDIAYYHSACTSLYEADDKWPNPTKIHNEDVLNYNWYVNWGNPSNENDRVEWPTVSSRFFLDMTRQDVREEIITTAIERASIFGCDAIGFDNCYWGQTPFGKDASGENFPISWQDWHDGFLSFYEEAYNLCQQNNLLVIFNIAANALEIPDMVRTVTPICDGIMTEMPFHLSLRNEEDILNEKQAYEFALKNNKRIYLFPDASEEDFTLKVVKRLAYNYNENNNGIFVAAKGASEWNPLYVVPEDREPLGIYSNQITLSPTSSLKVNKYRLLTSEISNAGLNINEDSYEISNSNGGLLLSNEGETYFLKNIKNNKDFLKNQYYLNITYEGKGSILFEY